MAADGSFDVFLGGPVGFDPLIFRCWVAGLPAKDVPDLMLKAEAQSNPLLAEKGDLFDDTDEAGLLHAFHNEAVQEFRTFELAEGLLREPGLTDTQFLPYTEPWIRDFMTNGYYDLSPAVVRELLCKRLSKARKELPDISEYTHISLPSCTRQFENLRRVREVVESCDEAGDVCDLVAGAFHIGRSLAWSYVAFLFLQYGRFTLASNRKRAFLKKSFFLTWEALLAAFTGMAAAWSVDPAEVTEAPWTADTQRELEAAEERAREERAGGTAAASTVRAATYMPAARESQPASQGAAGTDNTPSTGAGRREGRMRIGWRGLTRGSGTHVPPAATGTAAAPSEGGTASDAAAASPAAGAAAPAPAPARVARLRKTTTIGVPGAGSAAEATPQTTTGPLAPSPADAESAAGPAPARPAPTPTFPAHTPAAKTPASGGSDSGRAESGRPRSVWRMRLSAVVGHLGRMYPLASEAALWDAAEGSHGAEAEAEEAGTADGGAGPDECAGVVAQRLLMRAARRGCVRMRQGHSVFTCHPGFAQALHLARTTLWGQRGVPARFLQLARSTASHDSLLYEGLPVRQQRRLDAHLRLLSRQVSRLASMVGDAKAFREFFEEALKLAEQLRDNSVAVTDSEAASLLHAIGAGGARSLRDAAHEASGTEGEAPLRAAALAWERFVDVVLVLVLFALPKLVVRSFMSRGT